MRLAEIADDIREALDEKEAVREAALKSSRSIVRQCASAIMLIQRGEDAGKAMAALRRDAARLKSAVAEHPEMEHAGFVEAADQEFAEAAALHAISRGAALPGHRELGVTPQSYLEGMGDVVGELRRMALTAMMAGDVASARRHLKGMDDIYDFLMGFDYPAALAGVKRKQDVARSLVEKTRGELAVAMRARSLEARLGGLERRLGKKKL
jgi:translin